MDSSFVAALLAPAEEAVAADEVAVVAVSTIARRVRIPGRRSGSAVGGLEVGKPPAPQRGKTRLSSGSLFVGYGTWSSPPGNSPWPETNPAKPEDQSPPNRYHDHSGPGNLAALVH